jgi:hypothetical protein
VQIQIDKTVATVVANAKNPLPYSFRTSTPCIAAWYRSMYASYASEIADFVTPLEPDHRSPRFFHLTIIKHSYNP